MQGVGNSTDRSQEEVRELLVSRVRGGMGGSRPRGSTENLTEAEDSSEQRAEARGPSGLKSRESAGAGIKWLAYRRFKLPWRRGNRETAPSRKRKKGKSSISRSAHLKKLVSVGREGA